MESQLDLLINRSLKGDRRSLARLFTRIESSNGDLRDVMRKVNPHVGRTYCVGITGPPGAGKSTLTNHLIAEARSQGNSVGVIAVDPSSPFSGGAILGDRIHMQNHYRDRKVFIRSLASRGTHGGLSQIASAAVRLLDAIGKDLVIVETVGVGQTGLDIIGLADSIIVVLVPEAGDSVQAMKAGLMEIADIFVINKADREGALQLSSTIKNSLSLNMPDRQNWQPTTVLTQAHKGKGLNKLYQALSDHRSLLENDHHLEHRRRTRRLEAYKQAMLDVFKGTLTNFIESKTPPFEILERVESGEMDPYAAALDSFERLVLSNTHSGEDSNLTQPY